MADYPLVPNQEDTPAAAAPPQPQDTVGLGDQWKSWMSNPHNRASLIQMGLALSQPIGAGQNALGHIGQAVGEGGSAADRLTAEEDKQAELASKQELRGAQATAAEARAGAAGTRASAAEERAQIARERLQNTSEMSKLRAHVALNAQYDKYAQGVQRQRLLDPNVPLLDRETWLNNNPMLVQSLTGLAPGAAGGGISPTRVRVNSPDDLKQYPSGTPYITPEGQTGTKP